jgi:hypothetical protein
MKRIPQINVNQTVSYLQQLHADVTIIIMKLTFLGSLIICSWGNKKTPKLPLMSLMPITFCMGPSLLGYIPNNRTRI